MAEQHDEASATRARTPEEAQRRTAVTDPDRKPSDGKSKGSPHSEQRKSDEQQAATAKADREAESGKRPSAIGYGQEGVGGQGGTDAPAARTWAHRQCGTEIEVPADQSHPAEAKCLGCRLDVDPNDWIPRGGLPGGVLV